MRLISILAALLVSLTVRAESPPTPGEKAPAFDLAAFPAGRVRLQDFKGRWLALVFYPKAQAPKDVEQMTALRESWPALRDLKCAVLGISMDPPNVIEKFHRELSLPFPLASDTNKTASTAYGALGLGGWYSSRMTVIVTPEGKVAEVINKVPEKQYGKRLVDRLKALQAPRP